jgi:drug/metabolite transporter (DMT)-like permease
MATRGERNVGLSLAGAGVGIIGVAIVFRLTTGGGGPDWVGIITAIAGLVMPSARAGLTLPKPRRQLGIRPEQRMPSPSPSGDTSLLMA